MEACISCVINKSFTPIEHSSLPTCASATTESATDRNLNSKIVQVSNTLEHDSNSLEVKVDLQTSAKDKSCKNLTVLHTANALMHQLFEDDCDASVHSSQSDHTVVGLNLIDHDNNNSEKIEKEAHVTSADDTTPEGSYVVDIDTVPLAEEVICNLPARQGNADRHFVVRATIMGESTDSLIDTWATISACKPERARAWARKGSTVSKLRTPLLVQLADGSTVKVTQIIKVKFALLK